MVLVKMDIAQRDRWKMISPNELVRIITQGMEKVLLIDSRSFLEYNTSHIRHSVNVCCSKLVKRRLQQDKVLIRDLLTQSCQVDAEETWDVIVYDQCTEIPALLSEDSFITVLLRKLMMAFNSVALLKGGFVSLQAIHPHLCETPSTYRCPTLTSLSQPCMPVTNGPTRILRFMYLGSQKDSLCQETLQVNGISYIINVSTTCPKPAFIQDSHFLRIPVNDNFSERMVPHFKQAFQYLDNVRESNGCVLVHCLAGISRSATLAIAYVMQHLSMSSEDAYRYVKDKRPTISPNFNFLGQLLDYEKQLKEENARKKECENDKASLKNKTTALDLSSPQSPIIKVTSPFFKTEVTQVAFPRESSTFPRESSTFPRESSTFLRKSSTDKFISSSASSGTFHENTPVIPRELSPGNLPCSRESSPVTFRCYCPTSSCDNTHPLNRLPTCPGDKFVQRMISTTSDYSSMESSTDSRMMSSMENSIDIQMTSSFDHNQTPAKASTEDSREHAVHLSSKLPRLRPFSFSGFPSCRPISAIHSPTTALARLSFSTDNPQEASSSHSHLSAAPDAFFRDLNVSQNKLSATYPLSMRARIPLTSLEKFPTTSIDKVNFVPCSVREDAQLRTKLSSGTKRPSSCMVTLSESPPIHTKTTAIDRDLLSVTETLSFSLTSSTQARGVILRQSESKARRTASRPNSIAFSTYPQFETPHETRDAATVDGQHAFPEETAKVAANHKRSKPCVKSAEPSSSSASCAYSEKRLYKEVTAAMESVLTRALSASPTSSRKSRSLENILSGEEADAGRLKEERANATEKPAKDRSHRHHAEMFATSSLYDTIPFRCRGSSDVYQSNSSISSSGSRSSIHGSLEVIQVS